MSPLILLLAACAPHDSGGGADPKDSSPGDTSACPTWYADDDSDGYGDPAGATTACSQPAGTVDAATDCDDTRADVHPGAQERCDDTDVDEDCDGAADDADPDATGQSTWYADDDGDSFGDAAGFSACDAPSGAVATSGDCDDHDAKVNPDAEERCDPANVDEDCDGLADDEDPGAVGTSRLYVDDDGDGFGGAVEVEACDSGAGFATNDLDCDDTDAAINPDADEICDETDRDEDCDGQVDSYDNSAEGRATYYKDYDGDGYGTPTSTAIFCEASTGWAPNPDDCDDARAEINPGVPEVCDEHDVDEDCDGGADNADSAPSDGIPGYRDEDGDDYGAGAAQLKCELGDGWVADGTDCDDTRADRNPGAAEVCDPTDVDEDCDGAADAADPDIDTSLFPAWYTDADGDGFGDATAATAACDAPSGYVRFGTDCDDTTDTIHPGATEVCGDGIDDDCFAGDEACTTNPYPPRGTLVLDALPATIDDSATFGSLGRVMTGGGDVDGDGYDDLVITEPDYEDAGRFGIVYGPYEGRKSFTTATDGSLYATTSSMHLDAGFGASSTFVGDQDGDGTDDLVVAAPNFSNGQLYFFLGSTLSTLTSDKELKDTWYAANWSGTGGDLGSALAAADFDGDGTIDLAASDPYWGTSNTGHVLVAPGPLPSVDADFEDLATVTLYGGSHVVFFGWAAASGDVDGDGVADLAVSSPDDGTLDRSGGEAWIFAGASLTSSSSDDADASVEGDTAGDGAGTAIDLGDFNGDGLDDLAIYAPEAELGQGQFAVFFSPVSGTVSTADLLVEGAGARDDAALTFVDDVDGDGTDELVLSQADDGDVYLFYGGRSGSVSLGSADLLVDGQAGTDLVGGALADLGDINGDGTPDIGIGAPGAGLDTGAIWILSGRYDEEDIGGADDTFDPGTSANDSFGANVAGAGDVNGDGRADVLITAPEGIVDGTATGYVGLWLGGSTLTRRSWFYGRYVGEEVGMSLDGDAQLDGDGLADLVIGSPEAGTAAVIYGTNTASNVDLDTEADVTYRVSKTCDTIATVRVAGDVNGDGDDALIFGSTVCDLGGGVFILEAPLSSGGISSLAAVEVRGDDRGDELGGSVAGAGDLDADGLDDVIFGAAADSDAGAQAGSAWILLGGKSGAMAAADADAQLTGENPGDEAGTVVAGVGDVDADGYADAVVGAPGATPDGHIGGILYVLRGPVSSGSLGSVETWLGGDGEFNIGATAGPAGDVDGDGYADVLAWDQGCNSYATGAGSTRLFYGPPSRMDDPYAWIGTGDYTYSDWYAAAGVGDVDWDGYDDIVIGSGKSGGDGTAWLFFGG